MNPIQLLYDAQFHGANRLADKSSRWFWVPALLVLLASAITLVILTVNRYLDNPIFMVQIEKGYMYQAFPSVTICPEISFTEEKMDQFLSELKYPKGMTPSNMRPILPQLAAFYSLDVSYRLPDLLRVEQLLDYNQIDVETVSRRLTTSCEEALIKCRWGRFTMNCSDLFRMEFTGDGFCCVFNGRSLRREMEEHSANIEKTHPSRNYYTKRFGYASGLMLAVNQRQKPLNIDLSYKWIVVRASQSFVDTVNNGTALNPGSEQWIAYHTRSFQIATGAKALSPSLRQCNMASDSDRLKYFPVYNKKYCVLEYEIANTLKRCKCVRMSHPRPPGATRCRAVQIQCAKLARVGSNDEDHHCLRTCDIETNYMKASSYYLDEKVNIIDPFYKNLNYTKVTVIRIFISVQKQYIKERWSYYSYFDLFAQLGGMFGIFLGCSVLTLLGLLQLGWHFILAQCQKLRKNPNDNK